MLLTLLERTTGRLEEYQGLITAATERRSNSLQKDLEAKMDQVETQVGTRLQDFDTRLGGMQQEAERAAEQEKSASASDLKAVSEALEATEESAAKALQAGKDIAHRLGDLEK